MQDDDRRRATVSTVQNPDSERSLQHERSRSVPLAEYRRATTGIMNPGIRKPLQPQSSLPSQAHDGISPREIIQRRLSQDALAEAKPDSRWSISDTNGWMDEFKVSDLHPDTVTQKPWNEVPGESPLKALVAKAALRFKQKGGPPRGHQMADVVNAAMAQKRSNQGIGTYDAIEAPPNAVHPNDVQSNANRRRSWDDYDTHNIYDNTSDEVHDSVAETNGDLQNQDYASTSISLANVDLQNQDYASTSISLANMAGKRHDLQNQHSARQSLVNVAGERRDLQNQHSARQSLVNVAGERRDLQNQHSARQSLVNVAGERRDLQKQNSARMSLLAGSQRDATLNHFDASIQKLASSQAAGTSDLKSYLDDRLSNLEVNMQNLVFTLQGQVNDGVSDVQNLFHSRLEQEVHALEDCSNKMNGTMKTMQKQLASIEERLDDNSPALSAGDKVKFAQSLRCSVLTEVDRLLEQSLDSRIQTIRQQICGNIKSDQAPSIDTLHEALLGLQSQFKVISSGVEKNETCTQMLGEDLGQTIGKLEESFQKWSLQVGGDLHAVINRVSDLQSTCDKFDRSIGETKATGIQLADVLEYKDRRLCELESSVIALPGKIQVELNKLATLHAEFRMETIQKDSEVQRRMDKMNSQLEEIMSDFIRSEEFAKELKSQSQMMSDFARSEQVLKMMTASEERVVTEVSSITARLNSLEQQMTERLIQCEEGLVFALGS